jgi:hypothetical protein
MCEQIYQISNYIGPKESLDKLFPELIDLIEDEEKEVSSDAFISIADHIAHLYRSPPFHETENKSDKNNEEETKDRSSKPTEATILGHELLLTTFKESF